MTVSIERIQSSLSIGNALDIQVRQASSLNFVRIIERTDSSDVYINTNGQEAGTYTLTLESFNALSIAKSALKTDTITITITVVAPSFLQDLGTVFLVKGVAFNIPLPEIK